jgi:hypothetical protein
VAIIHNKELSTGLSKIILQHANAYLKDGVAELKAKQKKSTVVSRNPLYLEITQNTLTRTFDDESSPRTIIIAPYIYEPGTTGEVALWLGFIARFDYVQHDFELTSVSISIIRGSQSQEYLLRAEWDSRTSNSDHAQPHWHAIPGPVTTNSLVEERWKKIQSGLHLAMCAKWRPSVDQGILGHTHALQQEDVLSWVAKTLDYIKQQLEFGLKSAPSSAGQNSEAFF